MNQKNYITFNPARPNQRSNYLLTSFASNFDDLSRESITAQISKVDDSEKVSQEKKKPKSIIKRIIINLHLLDPLEWIFILTFTIVVSFFLLFLEKLIFTGRKMRIMISSSKSPILNFLLWTISGILFMLLATSVGAFISPDADGSGIPEMKTVLSGVSKFKYFSFNAFIGKSLGLFAALVSGCSVGKVGPYVHLSCLICNRCMKVNYFNKINKHTSSKIKMLSIACAVGITWALGAPLGGVLFSIESTASIYIVSNLWKSFFSSVIVIIIQNIFMKEKLIEVINDTNDIKVNEGFKLFNFIIIGLICGAIGASCSTLIAKGVFIRKKTKLSFLNSRFKFAAIVGLITSFITFFITPLQKTDKIIMFTLFSANSNEVPKWNHPNEFYYLILCFLCKYCLTILGLICTIPSGVFGPIFSMGAIFGRIYGHIIYKFFKINIESGCAMIASAATFSGFSHTVSSALMVFEMTGTRRYLVPLLLSCLIANLVGQSLSMGIFDVLLAIKNLPYLPAIKSRNMYSLTAGDIMSKVDYFLEEGNLKIINALLVMSKMPKNTFLSVPIIDKKGFIKSKISAQNLFNYVFSMYNEVKGNFSIKGQSNFTEYFSFTKKKFFNIKRGLIQQIKRKFRKLYMSIRDKERLILNKNFKQESCMRIMVFFEQQSKKDKIFLGRKIDLNDKNLGCDKSCLTIEKTFSVIQIQFLFTFLNVSHVFVTDEGKLIGVITKEDFVQKTEK